MSVITAFHHALFDRDGLRINILSNRRSTSMAELEKGYQFTNETKHIIWWKDGSWYSGDLPAGKSKWVESNHIADVTVYQKIDGVDTELGRLWVTNDNGNVVVRGPWSWTIG